MNSETAVTVWGGISLPLIISIAALALSVLSPIISSIISGVFRLKEKDREIKAEANKRQQEFYEQHRAEVIESYIRAVGKACKSGTRANFDDYGASMGEIYLYVSKDKWDLLDKIANKIERSQYESPSEELIELCKALSENDIRSKHEETPDSTYNQ